MLQYDTVVKYVENVGISRLLEKVAHDQLFSYMKGLVFVQVSKDWQQRLLNVCSEVPGAHFMISKVTGRIKYVRQ